MPNMGIILIFELVTSTVVLEDGNSGTGYTYTGGKGGRAIQAMVEYDLKPFLLGKDGSLVEEIYEAMSWHIHYVGRGGIASFCNILPGYSALDIRCRKLSKPLWEVAGGADQSCKAYCGGIDLQFPLPKLLENIQGYLSRGFNAVKIKVGRDNLQEDIERVKAVRELIGNDIIFMVDANYSMNTEKAIEAALAFKEFNIHWFEEPTLPDHYQAYSKIT